MEGTAIANNDLIPMIARIDSEDRHSVKKYVAFLHAKEEDEDEEPTVAEKQKALAERRRDLAAGGVNLIELAAALVCYHLQGASFHPLGFRPI